MANDKVKVATSKLTALADAIRAKSGGSEEITLNDIPNIVPSLAAPPTWADGSWDDIAEALDKHKAGKINLYDYWNIGDSKTLLIPNIIYGPNAEYGAGNEDLIIRLVDKDYYYYSKVDPATFEPIASGRSIFVWETANVLQIAMPMDKSTDNTSISLRYDQTQLHNFIQKVADELPQDFSDLILDDVNVVLNPTASNPTNTKKTKVFIPSLAELKGPGYNNGSTNYNIDTQPRWLFYKNGGDLKKYRAGETRYARSYWTRTQYSPGDASGNKSYYAIIDAYGNADNSYIERTNENVSVSFAGCI